MKKVKLVFVPLLFFSGAVFATIPITDLEGKIAYDGKEMVVAMTNGSQSGNNPTYTLHYSTNFGQDWETVKEGGANPSDSLCVKWYTPKKPNSPASLNSVHYLGNESVGYQFYAVGADGHVCRSRTGIDGWRLSDWGQNDPDHALRDMTAGNVCVGGVCKFLWVIVGHDGAIYTSENPETDSWHLRFTDRAKSFERVVYGATAAGGMFVAHTGWNASQDIFYSSDGITWTKAELSKFNPVPGLSGFSSLQYVSAKNEFVVLNLTVDEYKEYRPVAFSSGDGKNWTTDIAQPPGDFDTLRFNDIVYDANINKWFVAVGMRKNGNVMDATSGRGQLADVFSAYGFLVPNSAFYSVDYDGKANYYIATWFKDPTYGSPKESGIASIGPNGQWLPVQMLGKCGGVPVLFSKPIIATDPAGNAHYIVTPNYSEGCAYWSDGGPSWFASPYSWK